MPRPVLRLATRFTRRTRATAWAIAFACMVLVGALSLVDGLAGGVGSVADRIGSGPAVYIRGTELLASAIDPDEVAGIPGDFLALRAHPAFHSQIDRDALTLFLRYGYIPAPHTIYRGVYKLPPGTLLSLKAGAGDQVAHVDASVCQCHRRCRNACAARATIRLQHFDKDVDRSPRVVL